MRTLLSFLVLPALILAGCSSSETKTSDSVALEPLNVTQDAPAAPQTDPVVAEPLSKPQDDSIHYRPVRSAKKKSIAKASAKKKALRKAKKKKQQRAE